MTPDTGRPNLGYKRSEAELQRGGHLAGSLTRNKESLLVIENI